MENFINEDEFLKLFERMQSGEVVSSEIWKSFIEKEIKARLLKLEKYKEWLAKQES